MIVRAAETVGFRSVSPREYEYTSIIPLGPLSGNSSAAGGRFSRSVGKNARRTLRAGHAVRPIVGLEYVERMNALVRETMARSGADVPKLNLASIVTKSTRHPTVFRLVGLFRDGHQSPEALMAFRWCGYSGTYAEDLLAASTRLSDSEGRVPMMHAIMLDVLDWASYLGAEYFDFGGVVSPSSAAAAAVTSITKFKQQFGGEITRVGTDLTFVAAPVRSSIGNVMSRVFS
jgi:hypothetical protein